MLPGQTHTSYREGHEDRLAVSNVIRALPPARRHNMQEMQESAL